MASSTSEDRQGEEGSDLQIVAAREGREEGHLQITGLGLSRQYWGEPIPITFPYLIKRSTVTGGRAGPACR